MREGGQILAHVLSEVASDAVEGNSLRALDNLAEKLILGYGARPSFKGYRPHGTKGAYPCALCISLNHEVVHGLPDRRILKNGDVVSLDLGVFYNGFHTDAALTLALGQISFRTQRLLETTKKSLALAIKKVRAGICWGDIAAQIQNCIANEGFSVIRELVGHGIGRNLQEEPFLPNFGRSGEGPRLQEGMVIAIEPMVSAGQADIELGLDGFVWQTKDKSLSAHFEHTVAITKQSAIVLTQL